MGIRCTRKNKQQDKQDWAFCRNVNYFDYEVPNKITHHKSIYRYIKQHHLDRPIEDDTPLARYTYALSLKRLREVIY